MYCKTIKQKEDSSYVVIFDNDGLGYGEIINKLQEYKNKGLEARTYKNGQEISTLDLNNKDVLYLKLYGTTKEEFGQWNENEIEYEF